MENNTLGLLKILKEDKLTKSLSKPVLQFSQNGEFLKEYCSLAEVERITGYSKSQICNYLKGNIKYCYGFV